MAEDFINLPVLERGKAVNESKIEYTELSCNPLRGCSHRCTYCLSGETLILMSNGTNIPIKNINIGDEIIGVQQRGKYKKYVKTKVINHWETTKPAIKIIMENGNEIICSPEHRWLTNRGWKHTMGAMQGKDRQSYLTLTNRIFGIGKILDLVKEPADLTVKKSFAIKEIIPLNETIDMYDITTTTGNFIANGLISHNCYSRDLDIRYKRSADEADWHKPRIFTNILKKLKGELERGRIDPDKEIFVSTMTDVYQPFAFKHDIARKVITLLQEHNCTYRVLTKSPLVAKDIDLYDGYKKGKVGLSITTNVSNDAVRKEYEPGTQSIQARLDALEKLSEADIRLWISFEPFLPKTDFVLALHEMLGKETLHNSIVEMEIGKMNYMGVDKLFDWKETVRIFENVRADFPDIHWHYKSQTTKYLLEHYPELTPESGYP